MTSVRKMRRIWIWVAPIVFKMPMSRTRSRTIISTVPIRLNAAIRIMTPITKGTVCS